MDINKRCLIIYSEWTCYVRYVSRDGLSIEADQIIVIEATGLRGAQGRGDKSFEPFWIYQVTRASEPKRKASWTRPRFSDTNLSLMHILESDKKTSRTVYEIKNLNFWLHRQFEPFSAPKWHKSNVIYDTVKITWLFLFAICGGI